MAAEITARIKIKAPTFENINISVEVVFPCLFLKRKTETGMQNSFNMLILCTGHEHIFTPAAMFEITNVHLVLLLES